MRVVRKNSMWGLRWWATAVSLPVVLRRADYHACAEAVGCRFVELGQAQVGFVQETDRRDVDQGGVLRSTLRVRAGLGVRLISEKAQRGRSCPRGELRRRVAI